MNFTQSITVLALLPMLAGPALANPRGCVSCVKKAVAVKRVVKQEVIVKKEVAAVAFQVAVPVYLAQVLPAPAVTYNITTPPPPAAPVQQIQTYAAPAVLSASVSAYGVTAAAPQQVVQQTQASTSVTDSELATALRAINERLCKLEEKNKVPNPNPNPFEAVKGSAWGTLFSKSCSKCHGEAMAAKDGGRIVLSDAPTPAQRMKIIGVIAQRSMPPQPNKHSLPAVSAEEANAVIAELSR